RALRAQLFGVRELGADHREGQHHRGRFARLRDAPRAKRGHQRRDRLGAGVPALREARRLSRVSRLGAALVGRLVRWWPEPTAARTGRCGAEPATEAYDRRYAEEQFLNGVWFGSPLQRDMPAFWGKRVLEVGCGHGGITCYAASMGAKLAVGIDLGTDHLRFG